MTIKFVRGPIARHVRRSRLAAALSATLFAVSQASVNAGQESHMAHGSSGHTGAAFEAMPLPPPPLMDGIGTSEMTITTRSPLAQQYFNQGLRLLHCFWDFEAYRAFKEAARHDSEAAMVQWGIYMALQQNAGEMAEERKQALANALRLSPQATERERAHIQAVATLQSQGRAAYILEMEALIDRFPDDIEAQLFLARFLSASPGSYDPQGRPREGKVYGQTILRNLMATHPAHPAVHHYWIHAVENGPNPERALKSSNMLARLAPR